MPDPEVSVVVAARDEERHLGSCLRSIRRQRGPLFECIVVDDGSVDETNRLVADLAAADHRFRLIRHDEARGLSAARNAGLAAARADLVTFVDGDDFLFPSALRSRCGVMASSGADVIGCYGDWVSVPEVMPAVSVPLPRRAARRSTVWFATADHGVPFIASAPVLRTALVRALGGFDESSKTAEDADFWQWWLRLAGRNVYVSNLCVGYRRRAGSMTRGDLVGHFRANTRAFESFDRTLVDAPTGVLDHAESWYRSALASVPRAGLAAAVAVSTGREAEAGEVLSEIDPVVLRLADPSAVAAAGTALGTRRLRGTRGGRSAVAALRDSAERLRQLVAEAAAPVPSSAELIRAAEWLATQR